MLPQIVRDNKPERRDRADFNDPPLSYSFRPRWNYFCTVERLHIRRSSVQYFMNEAFCDIGENGIHLNDPLVFETFDGTMFIDFLTQKMNR